MLRRNLFQVAAAGAMANLAPAQTSSSSKPRLRTALCAYSFRKDLESKRMSYDDVIRLAVDLDVDGVDMTVYWLPDTTDATLLPLRRLAYKNAVEIYSISVRTEMTKPAGAERDKEIAGLRKWVDVAEKLGAGHIRVFGGKVPAATSEDQAAQWVADVLKVGSEYAGSKGIILGLENHGGITDRADTVIKIVKAVNSPWVGINLDTGNFSKNAYQADRDVLTVRGECPIQDAHPGWRRWPSGESGLGAHRSPVRFVRLQGLLRTRIRRE